MNPDKVRAYTQMVERICVAHRFEPLITLTSMSHCCFGSTVPLLFDRADDKAQERASRCYDALFDAGQQIGCIPYRTNIDSMQHLTRPGDALLANCRVIKRWIGPAKVDIARSLFLVNA